MCVCVCVSLVLNRVPMNKPPLVAGCSSLLLRLFVCLIIIGIIVVVDTNHIIQFITRVCGRCATW